MKIVKIPGETKALIDELKRIRDRKKADAEREGEITTILKQAVDEQAATLYYDKAIVAMIELKSSTRIDSDKLRANYPDVAKDCTTTSSYLTVKVC